MRKIRECEWKSGTYASWMATNRDSIVSVIYLKHDADGHWFEVQVYRPVRRDIGQDKSISSLPDAKILARALWQKEPETP